MICRLLRGGAIPVQRLILENAPPTRAPYSHAAVAGGFIFISGQGPFTLDDQLVEGPFAEQAIRTFENVQLVLEGAGAGLEDIVRVGIYLRDMANFPELNQVYADFFPYPYPARTCIPSPLPRFELEVDAVAFVGEGASSDR
ncbi:MAG: RidA family protein [Actinomycetota bacterium]